MDELIGKKVDRYEVAELLGKGGTAAVYKASDTALSRWVALKLIFPEQQQDAKFLRRFQREARSLAQLSHESIIAVWDCGVWEGRPFLVTEYAPNGTLQNLLNRPWGAAEAAAMLIPIARALEYTHSRGIFHRDIKPSNILLDENNKPKLGDFGIAKLTDTNESQSLTGTGAMIGTPAYMAPEQVRGGRIDARTDIYALALVFFEMVTGRMPFIAENPFEIALKHLNDPPPHARQFVREIPLEVEQALLKAMAKAPEERYQTMAAFAADLEKFASPKKGRAGGRAPGTAAGAGETPQPGTPSAPDEQGAESAGPGGAVTRKKRFLRLALAGLAVLLLAGAGLTAWQMASAPSADESTPSPAAQALLFTETREPAVSPSSVPTASPAPATSLPETSPTPTSAPTLTAAAVTPSATPLPNRIQAGNLNLVGLLGYAGGLSVIDLDCTRDNRWVVVAGTGFINLINSTTMNTDPGRLISLGSGVPIDMALSADGRTAYLIIGSEIHTYDLESRQRTGTFRKEDGTNRKFEGAKSLAVSPDGQLLAVGTRSEEKNVLLVNTADGVVVNALPSNYGGWAVAFSPDDPDIPDDLKIAAATSQGVLMWEALSGDNIRVPGEKNTKFNTLVFSNDGRRLAAGGDGKIVIWDIAAETSVTLNVPPERGSQTVRVTALRFTPDDTLLVSGSDDSILRVWDPQKGPGEQILKRFTEHAYGIEALCISQDGRFIASGSGRESTVRFWGQ